MPVLAPLVFVLTGCMGSADPLGPLDERYTKVMVSLGAAERDSARNVRNKEARRRRSKAERARVDFFHDGRNVKAIEAARESEDPVLKAKADAYWRHMLLYRSWEGSEKADETRLLGRLEEAAASSAMWHSPDGELEIDLGGSWSTVSRDADDLPQEIRDDLLLQFTEHQMTVVNKDLQELVRLRNEVARRAGFTNYWELGLAGEGLTPADVDTIIAELKPVVAPSNQALRARIDHTVQTSEIPNTFANQPLLKRKAGLESARTAVDSHFDTDLAEERVMTAFQDMGISTEGWQVYIGPTRYVRSGVYGFPIRPPEHIAIVMSESQRWSMWSYEALAHEAGHAAWWKMLGEESSPPLWSPPAPWFEGFAFFFERQVYEPGFLARYVPDVPAQTRVDLANWRARQMGAWITDGIVQTLVERRLYEDPNNLEAIARFAAETRSALTGAPVSTKTEQGLHYDDSLLSSILWNYPAYSQNYLFAYLTEAWLSEAVQEKIGEPIANDKLGPLLRDALVRGEGSFESRLAAIKPGDRIDALGRYIQTVGPPPAPEPTSP